MTSAWESQPSKLQKHNLLTSGPSLVPCRPLFPAESPDRPLPPPPPCFPSFPIPSFRCKSQHLTMSSTGIRCTCCIDHCPSSLAHPLEGPDPKLFCNHIREVMGKKLAVPIQAPNDIGIILPFCAKLCARHVFSICLSSVCHSQHHWHCRPRPQASVL
eukprot:GGOE01008354.1.p2 GENE.GGOE01008354.1~~GGOE01008354.1.p2  ORF type:complete len:158 (-),score=6.64 GGOE01008354.1:53-526(-)